MQNQNLSKYLFLGILILFFLYYVNIYSKKLVFNTKEYNKVKESFDEVKINNLSKKSNDSIIKDNNKPERTVLKVNENIKEYFDDIKESLEEKNISSENDVSEELIPGNTNSGGIKSLPALLDELYEVNKLNRLEENVIKSKYDKNFFKSRYHIGFNTISQPVRNGNVQLRSEPLNPQVMISPWYETTIEPDTNRKMLFSLDELKNVEKFNSKKSDPCSDNLTDNEYLEHMIPHHKVAVDISVLLQKITENPRMQKILRVLIWTQRYEISLMREMLNGLPNNVSSNDKMNRNYISTISDMIEPNKLNISDTYCDPNFFDPEGHMEHLKHMRLDDEMYLKHMIPHHQVAVDMSKKLLKNTKNDFMINLAYRIIRSQTGEIIMLSDLLKKNNNFYKSKIVN